MTSAFGFLACPAIPAAPTLRFSRCGRQQLMLDSPRVTPVNKFFRAATTKENTLAITKWVEVVMTTPGSGDAIRYRPDIDGLRAIAVLAVLGFHAFPDGFRGGSVGVDVFFVISGFLISGIVLGELARGRFSFRRFYERRARRLLPALLIVLTLTTLAAGCWLYPGELQRLGRELVTGAAFVANLSHLKEEHGYFSIASESKILLHLWSLGVEEQFYFLWPALMALAFATRSTGRMIAVAVGLSLVFSAYWTPRHPADAFYLPTTRLWELGLGALLERGQSHLLALRPVGLAAADHFVSIAGLLLIAGAVLLFSSDLPLPGVWALIPTLGAALVIAAGPQAVVNRKLLSHPVFVHIGKISYPLYLWHWPLLSLTRVTSPTSPSTMARLGILVVAGIASELTYRYVELPVRRRPYSKLMVGGLLAGLISIAAVGLGLQQGWIRGRLYDPHLLALEGAAKDTEFPGRFNFLQKDSFKGFATSATPARSGTAVFIGDSHMEQYWPRIEFLAEQKAVPARKAVFITHRGCQVLPGLNRLKAGYACDRFLAYALTRAEDPAVDTVVFSACWESYFLNTFEEHGRDNPVYAVDDISRTALTSDALGAHKAFAAFEKVIAGLVARGKRVFLVLPGPTSVKLGPLWRRPARFAWDWTASEPPPGAAAISRSEFTRALQSVYGPLTAIAQRTGARLIDPLDTLCEKDQCSALSATGTVRYQDGDHLRSDYVRENATYLDVTLTGN
jgi:peptidoglycan/LPS O-acetylase OafA/YrhL